MDQPAGGQEQGRKADLRTSPTFYGFYKTANSLFRIRNRSSFVHEDPSSIPIAKGSLL